MIRKKSYITNFSEVIVANTKTTTNNLNGNVCASHIVSLRLRCDFRDIVKYRIFNLTARPNDLRVGRRGYSLVIDSSLEL